MLSSSERLLIVRNLWPSAIGRIAVLIGAVLSTLYPAMRAARTDPAAVLRYE